MGTHAARSFLYLHTSDLVASRDFYSQVIGLREIFSDDETVGYVHGGLQITVRLSEGVTPQRGWSRQLGWRGGDEVSPSLGIEVDTEDFTAVVRRSRRAGVEMFVQEPHWVGYWSLPIKDPMGITLEISNPHSDAWAAPGAGANLTDA